MRSIKNWLLSSLMMVTTLPVLAQIQWHSDYESALNSAQYRGKLIVVDFWASWCRPCIQMDMEVWGEQEIMKLNKDFVFVKIDVDRHKSFAQRMQIKAIPTLLVMDIDNNKFHNTKGFADAERVLYYLRDIPRDVSEVYAELNKYNEDKNWRSALNVAILYQEFAENVEKSDTKKSLYTASNMYFNKAAKVTKSDESSAEVVAIYKALSKARRTNAEKAMKDLDKLYASSTGENEDLFNYAYCCGFMIQGDLSKADSYYDKLAASEEANDMVTKIDKLKKENSNN